MLKTRLITSLVLFLSIGAAFVYLPPLYWGLLVLAVTAIGAWEWAGMSKFNKAFGFIYSAFVLLLGLFVILFTPQSMQVVIIWGVLVAAIFWLLIAPFLLAFAPKINNRF